MCIVLFLFINSAFWHTNFVLKYTHHAYFLTLVNHPIDFWAPIWNITFKINKLELYNLWKLKNIALML